MKVRSGWEAMQERILMAILQGNAQLLESLLQTQIAKAAFMRVYKDNFWFMNNDSTAMQAILNSSTAMQAIILSQTALDVIRANNNAWQSFINSNALTRRQVPQMTSNTAPEGIASASSFFGSGYEAFKAFDKDISSTWRTASGANTDQWLRYDFPVEVFVHTVAVRNSANALGARNVRVQRSSDGTNWETVAEATLSNANTSPQTIYVSRSGYARMWRLFMVDNYGGGEIAIIELNFTGFQKEV